MPRDDFSKDTKDRLARRAGYRCCFPNCGRPTYGTSEESDNSTTNTGTACHISSASAGPGARRYNPNMTSEERKHIDNGIWMCRTHGKLIDDDEIRFGIEKLKKWRGIGEQIAKIMSEQNVDYDEAIKISSFTELVPETIKLNDIGSENEIVTDLINDSCLSIAWGKTIAFKIQDFLIEYIRNTFQHGEASELNIEIKNNHIIVKDNGNDFNPKNLISSDYKSGGTLSIKELNKELEKNLILTNRRENNENLMVISILNNLEQVIELTPCSHKISYHEFRRREVNLKVNDSCNELFIVLPNYISPSDIGHLTKGLFDLKKFDKPITLITPYLSDLVSGLLKEYNPDVKIIEIDLH